MNRLMLSKEERTEMLEFVDAEGKLVLYAPRAELSRIGLPFRAAAVIVRQGRRMLARREPNGARRWGIYAFASVHAGESRMSAALRSLGQELGIRPEHLSFAAALFSSALGTPARITLFTATLPRGAVLPALDRNETLFLDKDELHGLAEQAPELLTPLLLLGIQEGWV